MAEIKRTSKSVALKSNRSKKSTETNADVTQDEKRSFFASRRNKWILGFIVLFGLLSVFGYMGYKNLVLAWVDKTPITRLNLYSVLEKRYGKDFTERLITETLIINEAKARGVEATDTELDSEIKKIEDQQGGADKLNQALESEKMTRDDLEQQIKFRVLIDKMFGKDVAVTAKDLDDYIEKNKAQYPVFENPQSSEAAQMRQSIADNLKSQKVSQSFNEWLTKSLQSSRINRL